MFCTLMSYVEYMFCNELFCRSYFFICFVHWYVLYFDTFCSLICFVLWYVLYFDMFCTLICFVPWYVLYFDMLCNVQIWFVVQIWLVSRYMFCDEIFFSRRKVLFEIYFDLIGLVWMFCIFSHVAPPHIASTPTHPPFNLF